MDNAATSWPKPPGVIRAMSDFLARSGGNPGRSGHRLSIAAARAVYETREAIAEFFNVGDPLRVIFTPNATYAINIVLRGLLRPGDRVVTTSIEHNAVMRPLMALVREGVEMETVNCRADGSLDPGDMKSLIGPVTRLVVVNHASNVTGTILPIDDVSRIAHRAGALVLIDAAQTAGVIPIDVQANGVDFLAFTGHKSLLGPNGTGGLVIGENVDIRELNPLVRGGTGSKSDSEEQPEVLPDKYEAGTVNAVGIAGLKAALDYINDRGLDVIHSHETVLTRLLLEGLMNIPGLRLYGPADASRTTGVVSFTADGVSGSEIGLRLDEEFGVLCRVGLHCAPAAHRTIGTFPAGTVRLAPGVFTTVEDVEYTVDAVKRIMRS